MNRFISIFLGICHATSLAMAVPTALDNGSGLPPSGLRPHSRILDLANEIHKEGNIRDSMMKSFMSTKNSDGSSQVVQRRLADLFTPEAEELLQQFYFDLPDMELKESGVTMELTNFGCSNITVGDILMDYTVSGAQSLTFSLDFSDAVLICGLKFGYKTFLNSGVGYATANTFVTSAKTSMVFTSDNFDEGPPSLSEVQDCQTQVAVQDLDFSGSVTAVLLNLFETVITKIIESEINVVVCDVVRELGTDLLGGVVNATQETVEPYLEPAADWRLDPLYPESQLEADLDVVEDLLTYAGPVMNYIDATLDDWIVYDVDPDSPTGEGMDLRFNTFLRQDVLEEDGSFALGVDDWIQLGFNETIITGGADLYEFYLNFLESRLYGLDTTTSLDLINNYGNFTTRNTIAMRELTLELDVEINVKAVQPVDVDPELYDRSVNRAGGEELVENVTISFGVKDIELALSLLFMVDPLEVDKIQVGSLMRYSTILPCVNSALSALNVTELDVMISDLPMPVVKGFISDGFDALVAKLIGASYRMYRGTILKAVPGMSNIWLRDEINWILDDEECPANIIDQEFVDFRDLLMSSEDAKAAGATGDYPYGELATTLFYFVDGQLRYIDTEGELAFNKVMIRPLTEGISGVEGTILLEEELLNISSSMYELGAFNSVLDGYEFSVSNLRMENIDSFVPPLEFLNPKDAHILGTSMMLANYENPVNITLTLAIKYQDGVESVQNIIDVGMSMSSLSLDAEIFATISAQKLLEYPLESAFDVHCWAALVSPPTKGNATDLNESGFRILSLLSIVTDLAFEATCVQCETYAAEQVPGLLRTYQARDVVRILENRLPVILNEIAINPGLQRLFDDYLTLAPKLCPQRMEYDGNATIDDIELKNVSPSSSEASDAFMFFGLTGGSFGVIVFALSHADVEYTPSDPLSGQNAMDVPDDFPLFNLGNITEIFLPEYAETVDSLKGFLTEYQTDNTTGEVLLGVNVFFRQMMDGDGYVTFSFSADDAMDLGPISVLIHSVRMKGLDTFSEFILMEAIANQTLQNKLVVDEVSVQVNMTVGASNSSVPVIFEVDVQQLTISAVLFAAFNEDLLSNIKIGNLNNLEGVFECVGSTAHSAYLTQLLVELQGWSAPKVSGLRVDSGDVMNDLFENLHAEFGDLVMEKIPVMFDMTIRDAINDYINSFGESGCSVDLIVQSRSQHLDMRDLLMDNLDSKSYGGSGEDPYGTVIPGMVQYMRDQYIFLDPIEKITKMEQMINALTNAQSGIGGNLHLEEEVFSIGRDIELGETILLFNFSVFDVRIENIDSLSKDIGILENIPGKAHHLNSSFGIGFEERPVRLAGRVIMSMRPSYSEDYEFYNEIEVSVDLHEVTTIIETLSLISEKKFLDFPIKDSADLSCWLSLIPAPILDKYGFRDRDVDPTLAVTSVNVSIAHVGMKMNCLNCTSIGLLEMSGLLGSSEALRELTETTGDVLDIFLTTMSKTHFQNILDRELNDAQSKCPQSLKYDQNFEQSIYEPLPSRLYEHSTTHIAVLMGLIFLFAASITLLVIILKYFVRGHHQRWMKTLSKEQVYILKCEQEQEVAFEENIDVSSDSMFTSSEIPTFVRYLIPFLVVLNIAFFMSGHLSKGAFTRIEISLAGQDLSVDNLFTASVVDTVRAMLDVGSTFFAYFIIIFSMIWPYLKQLVTFVMWFVSPHYVSVSRRGNILLWLDTLAKWSMVDIFVMIISLASFRIFAETPNTAYLPREFMSIAIYTELRWGLYANLLAQVISQISSHFIIHYHRKIVEAAQHSVGQNCRISSVSASASYTEQSKEKPQEMTSRLCQKSFSRPHQGESQSLRVHPYVNFIVALGSISLFVLLVLGCIFPCISVEFQGLGGLLMSASSSLSVSENIIGRYSIFDISVMILQDGARTGKTFSKIGSAILGFLVVFSVFFAPLLQIVLLICQWFMPMRERTRQRLGVALEILQAWQYLEVFILAVLMGAWQFGATTGRLMMEVCGDLQELIDMLLYFDILEFEDANCFRTEVDIDYGVFFLAAAAILLLLFNTFVHKAQLHYLWDKQVYGKMVYRRDSLLKSEMVVKEFDQDEAMRSIHPPPVLFTDMFRWSLYHPDKTFDPLDDSGAHLSL